QLTQVDRTRLRLDARLPASRDQVLQATRAAPADGRLGAELTEQLARGDDAVRGGGRKTHARQEALHSARAGDRDGVDLVGTRLDRRLGRGGEQRVPHATTPRRLVDVDALDVQH